MMCKCEYCVELHHFPTYPIAFSCNPAYLGNCHPFCYDTLTYYEKGKKRWNEHVFWSKNLHIFISFYIFFCYGWRGEILSGKGFELKHFKLRNYRYPVPRAWFASVNIAHNWSIPHIQYCFRVMHSMPAIVIKSAMIHFIIGKVNELIYDICL
jgi:hypothetical protein